MRFFRKAKKQHHMLSFFPGPKQKLRDLLTLFENRKKQHVMLSFSGTQKKIAWHAVFWFLFLQSFRNL